MTRRIKSMLDAARKMLDVALNRRFIAAQAMLLGITVTTAGAFMLAGPGVGFVVLGAQLIGLSLLLGIE